MPDLMTYFSRLLGGVGGGLLDYKRGRLMLDHPDKDVRKSLAERADLDPEMLFFLAGDPEPDVRQAVANNPSASGKAWIALAEDESTDIRAALALRLPTLLQTRSTFHASQSVRAITTALRLLARDELPRIRLILSETLRQMPDVPGDVITMLAKDPIEAIALPIIELSPVLTDADLIEIINTSPLTSALVSVSRRKSVTDIVSEALVHTGNSDAIESLLRNPSAQIREATLDLIVDMAPSHPQWHEPLVQRPKLSAQLVERIARFVTDGLLDTLIQRTDLEPSTIIYVRQAILARVNSRTPGRAAVDLVAAATSDAVLRPALFRAETLCVKGHLTPHAIVETVMKGLSPLALAMISVQAGIPVQNIAKAVHSGSPRTWLAIAWAADLTAEQAVVIQRELGRVSPESVIRPTTHGFFAATTSEMRHLIDALNGQTAVSAA